MNPFTRLQSITLVVIGLSIFSAQAHPVPDIPIRSHFDSSGNLKIRAEVDWRAYLDVEGTSPDDELYMLKWYHDRMDDEEKAEHIAPAQKFLDERVVIEFVPSGEIHPVYGDWEWRKLGDEPLENLDDPVVMVGEWTTRVPPGTTGYKVSSNETGTLTVVFENYFSGEKQERFAGLWPGESSFVLDISAFASSESPKVAMIALISVVVVGGVILVVGMLMRRKRD
ncbi:MAG: hypothetical protein ACI8UO_005722 [Verrucomicrobiales bacterium]|jgi:hypothetical protein